MITLTRLNGSELVLNDEQIEFLEKTPETVISLATGKKITVRETTEEVLNKIVDFRRQYNLPVVREQ